MNIKEYQKIFKLIETREKELKEINLFCKLEFYYNFKDFDTWQELNEKSQEKLIDYAYTYYIENDIIEHTIFNICELIINSTFYGFQEIAKNILKLSYKDFENIINEKI